MAPQEKGSVMSARNLDQRGRMRCKTVAFRVSPEEDLAIEAMVRMSGLTKQDYIIRRLREQEVTVQGNIRVYKGLRDQMSDILEELRRIASGDTVDPELQKVIGMMARIMEGMKEDYRDYKEDK